MAGLDAAAGKIWVHEPIGDEPDQWRCRTQRRWVERGGRALGLGGASSQAVADQIAVHLGVAGIEHRQERECFQGSGRLAVRGRAIRSVLSCLGRGDDLWPRMAASLSLSGEWGPLWLWDPGVGRRVSPSAMLAREPP